MPLTAGLRARSKATIGLTCWADQRSLQVGKEQGNIMAHFYGTIQGTRGQASRLGTRVSGLEVTAASGQGKVVVRLYEQDGTDYAEVRLEPHKGQGTSALIYRGRVGNLEGYSFRSDILAVA